MRARSRVIRCLDEIGSKLSLAAAVDHDFDCLCRCRTDSMGVRDILSAMLLRLGRDQECYDFIKWLDNDHVFYAHDPRTKRQLGTRQSVVTVYNS